MDGSVYLGQDKSFYFLNDVLRVLTTLMSSIQASNVELAMQSSLIIEAVLCASLAIIFGNVHNLSTGALSLKFA